MKRNKIIYYVSTGLLSLFLLLGVYNYIFNHEMISGFFESFGYPTYIIYPYAIAKILAIIALWLPNFKNLKEWAYAGLFYAFILAFFAHFMISDGEHMGALIAMTLLVVSYVFYKKTKG